jgi:hypothetical protein
VPPRTSRSPLLKKTGQEDPARRSRITRPSAVVPTARSPGVQTGRPRAIRSGHRRPGRASCQQRSILAAQPGQEAHDVLLSEIGLRGDQTDAVPGARAGRRGTSGRGVSSVGVRARGTFRSVRCADRFERRLPEAAGADRPPAGTGLAWGTGHSFLEIVPIEL